MRLLPILATLLLASWPSQGLTQSEPEAFRTFTWKGLSLSMTKTEIVRTLESQGYAPTTVNEQANKTVALYQKKTASAVNKVQFIEKGGALTRLSFAEVRVGGAKNFLAAEAADEIYQRARTGLELEDSACRASAGGGGVCSGQIASLTHTNSFSVHVSPRAVKIALISLPQHESVVAANRQTASGLETAYACIGTTDITSVSEVHDCLRSSSRELGKLPPQGSDRTHRPLQLDYPTLSCSNVTDYYRRGLSYLKKDTAAIPGCGTIAAVIERETGRATYWAACVDPGGDADSFKSCVAGYTPSLVNENRLYLPTCEEVQRSYKIGLLSAQPDSKVRDVAVPDCDYVLAQARTWRKELPESLKVCDGYDPDATAGHLMRCLSAERDLVLLTDCRAVRYAYERRVTLAHGYKPDDFYPLPCEQTEPLLAKAAEIREKKRQEAEEFARQLAEAKARAEQARAEHINSIHQKMAEKYSDTPEAVASRTSPLEKQIRAGGGTIPGSCSSPAIEGFYCPPTEEEVRLAMMRRHSRKTGFKIVNGHLLHGKQPTGVTFLLAMAGQPGKAAIGLELHYGEAELVTRCERRTGHHECRFRLPVKTNYDELTKMYMDGLTGGSAFNFNDFMFDLMDSAIAVEHYSFKFMLSNAGLWYAEPTIEQQLQDIKEEVQAIRP